MTNPATSCPSGNEQSRWWQWSPGFALAYLATAEAGHWLSFHQTQFISFWLPSGLFLFALIRAPYREWPKFLFGALLACEISDVALHAYSPGVSAGFWLANSLEAALGAYLFRRFSKSPYDLADVRQLGLLAGSSILVSSPLAALLGSWVVATFSQPGVAFWPLWLSWWSSVSAGILALTPVLLTFTSRYADHAQPVSRWRFLEMVLIFGLIAVVGCWVFKLPLLLIRDVPVPPFVMFLLLVWASFRFSLRGASAGVLMVIFISVWFTTRGYGPVAGRGQDFSAQARILECFMLACFLTALPLGAAVEARRRLTLALAEKAEALAKALKEIKTLRGILPICSHCKKIHTEAGEWQSVELYVRERTEADFSHGICPSCLTKHYGEYAGTLDR